MASPWTFKRVRSAARPAVVVAGPLLFLLLSAQINGCGRTGTDVQPSTSMANLEVLRPRVTIRPKTGKASDLYTGRRLVSGTEIVTGPSGRAALKLDLGASLLLDRSTRVKLEPEGVRLIQGRIWAEANAEMTVRTGQGSLRAVKAGFDVSLGRNSTRVYCASGEVTYVHARAAKEKDKGSGRLETGMTLLLQQDKPEFLPDALWEDWTAGRAQPGPRRAEPPAGIGQLEGRTSSELGRSPSPLLIRQHEVKVKVQGDMAVTEVTQTFFNPRSAMVDGIYRVRLPANAIVSDFSVGETADKLTQGTVAARFRDDRSGSIPNAILEWAGPDRYQGMVRYIYPGRTAVVRLTYVQWLEREPGRRIYVYPMGGGRAPLLAEFLLEVDLGRAASERIQASLGAGKKGNRIILRKSDYRPQADFILELMEPSSKKPEPILYRAASREKGEPSALYLVVDPPMGAPPDKLKMVLVADLSAGHDPAQIKLIKDTVDAALNQLKDTDEVAVLVAGLDVKVLGGKEALLPATDARRAELLKLLSETRASGATDLGAALEKAASMLPRGQGVVVYIGDGQPTCGLMLPGPIKSRLARLGVPPRIFAIGAGFNADMNFLTALAGESGLAKLIQTRPEASRTVFKVISQASRPSLRGVTVNLRNPVERIYPARPFTVVSGQQIRVMARSKGTPPTKLLIKGLANGKPFEMKVNAALKEVADQGDLMRRWAMARINELLQQGAGREAVADLGVRYKVLTAWTALAVGAYQGYKSSLPDPPPGIFSVEAMQDTSRRPLGATTVSLEPSWMRPRDRPASWEFLYRFALMIRSAPVRLCYDRKAAGHPELAGRVSVRISLRPDGSVMKVEQIYSGLSDPEVEACISRAISSLRLPAPPPEAPTVFTHTFTFMSPEGRHTGPIKCSKASYQYLARRKVLWRERLSGSSDVHRAMTVWQDAMRQCELKTWLDRATLLDLMLRSVGSVRNAVMLYHRFYGSWGIQAYLRRQILRRLKTRADVEEARVGLNLDGGVDYPLLRKGLDKAKTPKEKIDLVRKFLALSPDSLVLKALLMRLLEGAKRLSEAEELAWQIRSDPAAHAEMRQQVGEFFLRQGNKDEARRALSEMVELAPYDPWARQRLGHLYLSHGWCKDAYREYENLAFLMPHANMVLLMMARAAACQGRLDEALRLQARVSEDAEAGQGDRGPAAWARVMTSMLLARLRDKARKASDAARLKALSARGRRLGLQTWASGMLISLRWKDPETSFKLMVQDPGDELLRPVPLVSRELGLAALLRNRQLPGKHHVEIRLARSRIGRVKKIEAFLSVLWDEGKENEAVWMKKLVFDPETKTLAFTMEGRKLSPTKPKKQEKKEREKEKERTTIF